ncbi:MAG: Rrf2 family transcriptional regulator [Armatimonadetes bacterium]|nr:Rrf2 family transcriptional regulator [Armatimonadota bacterium]MBS1727350.1 Rrf2 family transcriptional regulator [Armatimonadota bacterium]
MLSSRARYATRALLDLSLQYPGGPILIQDIADRQKVPLKYLQQILLDLKQAGFLTSRKGPGGGYCLAVAPEDITLGQVLAAMDGAVVDLSCNVSGNFNDCGCPNPSTCAIRNALDEVAKAMLGVLNETTFADLRDRQRKADEGQDEILNYII